MAWALLDDNFPLHPKVMDAVHRYPLARDLFVCALCYCRKFHTDGAIPRHALKTIGFIGNERKAVDALLAVGLWDRAETGFQIHDYAAIYASDADDKADKEERRRKKQEAGRKGGQASWASRSSKQIVSGASSNSEAEPKHGASTSAEAHRDGVVRTGPVLDPGSSEEKGEPRFDLWLRELQQDYPQHRVTSGHMTEHEFFEALSKHTGGPWANWRIMRDNLENQKRGHEWRTTPKYIPKLENWLRSGAWKQRHEEHPPDAILSEKTTRTLSAAAAFIKAGES